MAKTLTTATVKAFTQNEHFPVSLSKNFHLTSFRILLKPAKFLNTISLFFCSSQDNVKLYAVTT
jgi:hypothetical protein